MFRFLMNTLPAPQQAPSKNLLCVPCYITTLCDLGMPLLSYPPLSSVVDMEQGFPERVKKDV